MSPPSVRPLIPFFLPTKDGTLIRNSSLNPSSSTLPNNPAPAQITLPVRTWDVKEGVFRDAIQVVRDLPPPPSPPPPTTPTTSPARLLTPAQIRQNRRTRPPTSPKEAPSTVHQAPVSAPLPCPISSPPKRQEIPSPSSPPQRQRKHRPFAGSTFEAASPPPAGLPIPAFARRSRPQSIPSQKGDADEESSLSDCPPVSDVDALTDPCEVAALELRRMLRI